MKSFSAYFIFLIAATCHAQHEASFTLVDKDSGSAIKNAYIYSKSHHTTSRNDGRAAIEFSNGEKIHISHVSYRDTSFSPNLENFPDTIRLSRSVHELNRVDVNTKPYLVFKSDECHVFDYEFLGDTLLILTYEREKMFRKATEQSEQLYMGCEILVISPSGNVLMKRKITDEVIGFHRDPLGQIYLKGQTTVFALELDHEIRLTAIDREMFQEKVEPLKEALGNDFIFDNYRWHYPEFSYFRFNRNSDSLEHIRTVKDSFIMELLRAEYKYMNNREKLWAYRKELETGIDKEVISAYKTGFQSTLYFESLYAPIFHSDSMLVIFDHHSGFIFSHSPEGLPIDSVELSYLNKNRMKFDDLILKDRKNNTFFSVFRKGVSKHLGRINLSSGKVERLTKLYYPFAENIKLHGGSVYYLYRKPESENYTYLFAESVE